MATLGVASNSNGGASVVVYLPREPMVWYVMVWYVGVTEGRPAAWLHTNFVCDRIRRRPKKMPLLRFDQATPAGYQ